MANTTERGNYFDDYERRINDPWNPLNFVPVEHPVQFGTVGVVDREAFDRIHPKAKETPIYEIKEPASQEVVLLAA